MYISYSEYLQLNGDLNSEEFLKNIDRAEAILSKHTKKRVLAMANVPECVKKCCKALVELLARTSDTVTSRSQSAGGVSESETYISVDDRADKIVQDFLLWETDDKGTYLLSRGMEY